MKRHSDKNALAAIIEDCEWLAAFQGGDIDVRFGGTPRRKFRREISYGYGDEILMQKNYLELINEVLPGSSGSDQQSKLDFSQESDKQIDECGDFRIMTV